MLFRLKSQNLSAMLSEDLLYVNCRKIWEYFNSLQNRELKSSIITASTDNH